MSAPYVDHSIYPPECSQLLLRRVILLRLRTGESRTAGSCVRVCFYPHCIFYQLSMLLRMQP
jgi:hypothetical protein